MTADWTCARCGTRETVRWWLALRAPAPGTPEVQVRLCDACRRDDDEEGRGEETDRSGSAAPVDQHGAVGGMGEPHVTVSPDARGETVAPSPAPAVPSLADDPKAVRAGAEALALAEYKRVEALAWATYNQALATAPAE